MLCHTAYANSYYFKSCKISNVVSGNYVINIKKNVIEVELKLVDGTIQNFSDAIKLIEKNKIISKKIKSGKSEDLYYQYILNSKSRSILKLEYVKQGSSDIQVFTLTGKRESFCTDIKADWDKQKIEEAKISKEQKQILEAQEKIKKEQSALIICQEEDFKKWNDCKGTHKAKNGLKYTGLFKKGKIIKGISIYPGGSKYVGEFVNFKPHGYGTFIWKNKDKYFGEWKNGKANGDGTKVWNDGRKYSGKFKNDTLHGEGTLFYPDGKRYVGDFVNGKRHGEGTFIYSDGTAYIGKFISGKEEGLGECVSSLGDTVPCENREVTQSKDFSGKDTHNISIDAKKRVRISQYENNSKKGKKIMDMLKQDFETQAAEICSSKGSYNVLDKKIEVLEVDDTPAYGLETVVRLGIKGVVECI